MHNSVSILVQDCERASRVSQLPKHCNLTQFKYCGLWVLLYILTTQLTYIAIILIKIIHPTNIQTRSHISRYGLVNTSWITIRNNEALNSYYGSKRTGPLLATTLLGTM